MAADFRPLEPDPRLSRKMNRAPTREDEKQFERLKGCSRPEVILAVGHPSEVNRPNASTEQWFYEWKGETGYVVFQFGLVDCSGFGWRQTGVISSPRLDQ